MTPLDFEQQELVSNATISMDLMKLTISQTMDITKILTGAELVPRKATISLMNVMHRIKVVMDSYDKEVPLSFVVDSKVYDSIITDEEWLWQMSLNLLTNACKYTSNGWIRFAIKLGHDAVTEKQTLRVEVADTGLNAIFVSAFFCCNISTLATL
jgi:signal transduction histidine kinase